jgi:hypothetical protein
MKFAVFIFTSLCLITVSAISSIGQSSGTSPFLKLELVNRLQGQPSQSALSSTNGHLIRDITSFDANSGIAYTEKVMYLTNDGGKTWAAVTAPLADSELIADADFQDPANGYAVMYDSSAGDRIIIAQTKDGGRNWSRSVATLPRALSIDAITSTAKLSFEGPAMILEVTTSTSSNFKATAVYRSADGGGSWELISRDIKDNTDADGSAAKTSGAWSLRTEGNCIGYKSGCYQETKLFINGSDLTPPQVKDMSAEVRERALADAVPMFGGSPAGPNRISLNRGFDKCTAGSVAQMQIWWDTSWHHDANIYFSGRNRACTQPQLTPILGTTGKGDGLGIDPDGRRLSIAMHR